MAVYEYSGVSATTGKAVKGLKDAENVKALRTLLRRDGVLLTTASEERQAKERRGQGLSLRRLFEHPSVADVAIMTRQLAVLVRAKIPLFESLSALIDQVEKEGLRRALTNIRDQVREGTAFADALKEPLEAVLERLTLFIESQASLKSKVTSALAYPILMLIIAVTMISVLMVAVVPKVTSIFESMDRALPWYTSLLITVSGFTASYWWLILIVVSGAVWAFRRWKRTPEGNLTWDTFVLSLPVFGSLVQMIAISRFSRTLATLLAAGVALLQAMGIVQTVLGNAALEKVVAEATTSIREGQSIAEPLKASGRFPPLVTHMIAIGEKSGQLEEMLENVANAYDSAVDNRVQMLTSLLEPIIIVVMGGAVAFIAMSILFPLIQMSDFVD
ncbi:MAG: type II secretion system F family protein [Deltaproteobacteria bacterium]|nr:type II secretion system F family protein [Deltaproteobacteria bacterium]